MSFTRTHYLAVATILVAATNLLAWQDAERFEVASIKRSASGGPVAAFAQMSVQPQRFRATNATLRDLIRRAYEVLDFQIAGDPPQWFNKDRFDITATTGGEAERSRVLAMLRALLAERFKLRAEFTTRELPIYRLELERSDGRLGEQLRPTSAECAQARSVDLPPDRPAAPGAPRCANSTSSIGLLKAEGYTMAELARTLTPMVGRVVQDATGLTDRYDWHVEFDPEAILKMNAAMGLPQLSAGTGGPSLERPPIAVALRDQLGLKLESATGLVPVVLIHSAELPSPD